MPETASYPPSAGPFPNKQNFLLNREKFPVGREFRQASHRVAAICCFPEAESRDFNALVLIFFSAPRARVRARGHSGSRPGGKARHLSPNWPSRMTRRASALRITQAGAAAAAAAHQRPDRPPPSAHRVEHHDRDLALGLLPVIGVGRPEFERLFPQPRPPLNRAAAARPGGGA